MRSGQTKAAVAKRTHRGGVTDVIPNIYGLVISTSVHPHIHRMNKRKKKFNLQNNFVFYRLSTRLFEEREGGRKYVSVRFSRLTHKEPNENPVFVHENHTLFLCFYCRVNVSETSIYASIRFNLDQI